MAFLLYRRDRFQRWGEPRFTQDADLTLLSGFGAEAQYIDTLLAHYPGRLEDTRDFALQTRVVLLTGLDGVPLDIALGAMPFEERTVMRVSRYRIDDQRSLLTCSAEDLIVHKAFAARPQDWLDIEGVIGRYGARLAWAQIWEGDTVVLRKGYGYADQATNTPNTPATVYRIGNLSRPFTAASILLLERQGKLSVQESICTYIDDCPDAWAPVTLHHVLSDSSGIPSYNEMQGFREIIGAQVAPDRTRRLPTARTMMWEQ